MEALAKTLEAATIAMVQAAPMIDADRYEAATRLALQIANSAKNSPVIAKTALAIELAIDGLRFGDIAMAAGLPALAMAASTLASTTNSHALDAARFELETLFPDPISGRRPTVAEPTHDVDITRLSRGNNNSDEVLARRNAPRLAAWTKRRELLTPA